jgi:hypothetical protein
MHIIPMRRLRTTLLFALAAVAGCSGPVDLMERSVHTARPLDDFDPVGAVDVEAIAAASPGADAKFFLHERAMEHLFELPSGGTWAFVDDNRRQYVVLDPEEEVWSTIRIFVTPGGNLEDYFGRVTSPDGTVRTFGKADLVQERDDDGVTYSLAYPGIERGSVVEEATRTRHVFRRNLYLPPLAHEVPLQLSVPVDTLRFRYVYPDSWALKVKRIGPNRMPYLAVDRSSEPGKVVLTYSSTAVPAVPDEPYAPFFAEVADYLEFQVSEIYVGAEKVFEAPTDWAAFAEDFKRYVFRSGTLFSDPAARAAADVVDAQAPDSAKLAGIVRWVQQNVEEDPGSDANSDVDVLRSRRGNAYFITGLTRAMLERAGLTADYLLIHPASEGYFDDSFVHDSEFSVPAVGVTVGGERRVVFPYLRSLPVDFIPEVYQGQKAIRITGDGFGGFEETPTFPAAESAIDENYAVRVDEAGGVEVEEEKVLRGAAAYFVRELLEEQDEEEREEGIRELLTYEEGEVQDFRYTVENEADYTRPLVIRLNYRIENLVTVTPEEVVFQTGGLLSPATLHSFRVDASEREMPIRIYNDEIENKRIVIEYPEGWALTTPLEDVLDENRFGSLTGRYTVEPGRLAVEQRVHLKAGSAPPRSYPTLLRITGSESRLYVPTLIFEVQG